MHDETLHLSTLFEARYLADKALYAFVSWFPGRKPSLDSLWPEVQSFLSRSVARAIFRRTASGADRNFAPEHWLPLLHQELDQAVADIQETLPRQRIPLTTLPQFEAARLHVNLCGGNAHLAHIAATHRAHPELFYVAVMNGSVGSNDFKPGWSDVDIFCSLSLRAVRSADGLHQARTVISEINRAAYVYNILQLHRVFVSSEIGFRLYTPSVLPIPCLQNGALLVHQQPELEIRAIDYTADVCAYFLNDIVQSTYRLLAKRRLGLLDKVLLLHRIYAFPLAFLQCLGQYVYKRESFQLLAECHGDKFPGVGDFYRRVNSFYFEWKVDALVTMPARRLLSRFIDPPTVNRYCLPAEKQVTVAVERAYRSLVPDDLALFRRYLETASTFVTSVISRAND